MASLSGSVVVNVGEEYIEKYLRSKGLSRTVAETGKEVEFWVDTLLERGQLSVDEFENFLNDELSYGKRKLIRVYEFMEYNAQNWFSELKDRFSVTSNNYSDILGVGVSLDQKLRIASIHSETNYKGDLQWVDILFVHYAEEQTSRTLIPTRSYIPVEIDFVKRRVCIRSWNRNGLTEAFRPNILMDKIYSIVEKVFQIKTTSKQFQRKRTLFSMSQGIVDEIYNRIPAYTQIKQLEEDISSFEKAVLEKLDLINLRGDQKCINRNAFDLHDEIQKVLEKLIVCDFFHNIPYERVWDLGVRTIISRIRFNDVEHVLTSLSGEESEMPIFCTKTFMALKKSMEDAKLVERLWVANKRERRTYKFRYDATNEMFLELMVLSNIRFNRENLQLIMEMYDAYDSEQIGGVAKQSCQCVS